MKRVSLLAHQFDCLPGHVTVRATGEGTSLAVAIRRAVVDLLKDQRLKHRQVGSFKVDVVVTGSGNDKLGM